MTSLEPVETPHLGGRTVWLRADTADRQVWADTFTGGYHVPPRWLPTPRRVLDAGANIGLTAAHYQHLWPMARIVAIELDVANAAVARINYDGRLVVCAVAGEDGEATYDPAAATDAYRLGGGSGRVQARRVGSLVDEYLGGSCDFAKLDVEGAEWDVLADGEWADRVAAVLVELHGDDEDAALVARASSELSALGYEVARHWQHPRAVLGWWP